WTSSAAVTCWRTCRPFWARSISFSGRWIDEVSFARRRAARGRPCRRAGFRAGQADRLRLPAAGLRHHPYRGGWRAVPVLLPQEGAHRGVVLGAAAERRNLELPDGQVGERMSVRRLADKSLQPKEFAFTAENLEWAKGQIAKYP